MCLDYTDVPSSQSSRFADVVIWCYFVELEIVHSCTKAPGRGSYSCMKGK